MSRSVYAVGSDEPGKGLTLDGCNISRSCRHCCQGVNFVDSRLITVLGTVQKTFSGMARWPSVAIRLVGLGHGDAVPLHFS